MQSFEMYRYTLVAPHVDNAGRPSGYPVAVRAALLNAGVNGWTEYETAGVWRGKREVGVTFEILSVSALLHHLLSRIGRECMPDQEAVQVTLNPDSIILWEA
jgi:hypothetical protein